MEGYGKTMMTHHESPLVFICEDKAMMNIDGQY
jgi:hypothetical protein